MPAKTTFQSPMLFSSVIFCLNSFISIYGTLLLVYEKDNNNGINIAIRCRSRGFIRLSDIKKPISVAVMGCVVNGPGEARGADVGIAGCNGVGLVFRKGEIIRKVDEKDLVDELFKEIDAILVEEEK